MNVAVVDRNCLVEFEKHFLKDFAISHEIARQAWRDRPWRDQLIERSTEFGSAVSVTERDTDAQRRQ